MRMVLVPAKNLEGDAVDGEIADAEIFQIARVDRGMDVFTNFDHGAGIARKARLAPLTARAGRTAITARTGLATQSLRPRFTRNAL
jgi:hypothetical protein